MLKEITAIRIPATGFFKEAAVAEKVKGFYNSSKVGWKPVLSC